jgi:hypothetical protein
MTLRFLDIRIGQVGVEASRAAIEKTATGPFAGVGQSGKYGILFDNARTLVDDSSLPWHPEPLYANKFWKKYVTGELAGSDPDLWAETGWQKLVPLRVPAKLPSIELPGVFRRSAEAFVWPTGFGFSWNNWVRAELGVNDVAAALERLRHGSVDYVRPGSSPASGSMTKLYHSTLDGLREALWGKGNQDVRADPLTIVSIIQVADAPSEKAKAQARQSLLKAIEDAWQERPRILQGDRHAEGGHTVYAAKGLRLAWLPSSFLAAGRKRSGGCFHRNLLFASFQVEMLAASARLLAQVQKKNGSLPAAYQSTVERVRERIKFFLSGGGYSAPFLDAQLNRQQVADARAEIGA